MIAPLGIIPADAGSTMRPCVRARRVWDHPRGCGEHARSAHPMRVIAGSSPRMRGARDRPGVQVPDHRIIPADAGSTGSSPFLGSLSGDHPRGCGEHPAQVRQISSPAGSSPRMRGARDHGEPADIHTGIIPADAGSTKSTSQATGARRDHPRGCGEHSGRRRERVTGTGSSPRMRGALEVSIIPGDVSRIIPADAGSTARPWGTAPRSRDHPRGCGEHGDEGMGFARVQGSSPRMRGARFFDLPACDAGRIIPADAGST